jgi:hypothetical protein
MSHGLTSSSRRALPASGAELPEKVPLEEEEDEEEEAEEGSDSRRLNKEPRERPARCSKCGASDETSCGCCQKGSSDAGGSGRKDTIEEATNLRRKGLGKQLTDILMMDPFRMNNEAENPDNEEEVSPAHGTSILYAQPFALKYYPWTRFPPHPACMLVF